MKQIYLIGGTMGVGKTAASNMLKCRLKNSVFLDGDWCWNAQPFIVTDETRAMVLDNIRHVLGNFIRCSAYENIIFCWVMHRQEIIDAILGGLSLQGCRVHCISLVCSPEALEARLRRDISAGLRGADILKSSMERLPLYDDLNTIKIDNTNLTIEETAQNIMQACKK